MAQIVEIEPPDYAGASSVLVFCDADSNVDAVKAVDRWARDHGFVRTNEYHLNRVLRPSRPDRMLFQGFCWRWSEGHDAAANEDLKRIAARRESMPPTPPSDDLLREEEE